MKAWIIFCIAVVTSPAFGQTAPAKIYVWTHPWFKSEIKSPTPPTWPYRVIDEKNGVVRVEVTPPDAQKPIEPKPTPPTVSAPAPQPKESVTISADKKEACKKMGLLGKAVAELRQKGFSPKAAEVAIENLLNQGGSTKDGIEVGKSIVRSIYVNKLTTANAEEMVTGTCEVMMYAAELQKNK